jgi:hypothetical protein
MEAAFAIASWQNSIAPSKSTFSSSSSSLIDEEENFSWNGLNALIAALHELYVDARTGLPIASDFSNESSTLLRNAILLALSTVKTQNGFTPLSIVKLLYLFATFQINCGEVDDELFENKKKTRDDDDDEEVEELRKSSVFSGDDSHYKAVLFLALSRLRFEKIEKGSPDDFMHKIVLLALSNINAAYTTARVTARINNNSNNKNLYSRNKLPQLRGGGIDVAAAITCLSEMDLQAVVLFAKEKSTGICMNELEQKSPTDCGVLSGFNYRKHFLMPGVKDRVLKCTIITDENKEISSFQNDANNLEKKNFFLHANKQNNINNISNFVINNSGSIEKNNKQSLKQKQERKRKRKDEIIYFLSSPLVRAASFEGFSFLFIFLIFKNYNYTNDNECK